MRHRATHARVCGLAPEGVAPWPACLLACLLLFSQCAFANVTDTCAAWRVPVDWWRVCAAQTVGQSCCRLNGTVVGGCLVGFVCCSHGSVHLLTTTELTPPHTVCSSFPIGASDANPTFVNLIGFSAMGVLPDDRVRYAVWGEGYSVDTFVVQHASHC